MSNLRHSLELQRIKLKEQYALSVESLQRIQELLRKADARRASEGGDARKWNKILENLEKSLDGAKARVDVSQLDLARVEREIARLGEDNPQPAATAPENTGADSALEDARDLVASGAVPPTQDGDGSHKRTQFVLRAAIEKIQLNRIEELSPAEILVVQACYRNLGQLKVSNPKNERLKRLITAAIKILNRRGQEKQA